MKKSKEIKKIVKKRYGEIVSNRCNCECSSDIGYSNKELKIAGDANLGLGCGNPVALSNIKEGDIVLDLGSGAGIDCFLAAKKVGKTGKVIGVDMTEGMVRQAKLNAKKQGYDNIEFVLGDIENLPVDDNSIDIIITNCVINLAPDKTKVFKEAHRALKKGGGMYISDIVLLKPLSKEQKKDRELLVGCVAGALLKEDYLKKIKDAGFFKINILSENKEISKTQYQGIAFESLLVEAVR